MRSDEIILSGAVRHVSETTLEELRAAASDRSFELRRNLEHSVNPSLTVDGRIGSRYDLHPVHLRGIQKRQITVSHSHRCTVDYDERRSGCPPKANLPVIHQHYARESRNLTIQRFVCGDVLKDICFVVLTRSM